MLFKATKNLFLMMFIIILSIDCSLGQEDATSSGRDLLSYDALMNGFTFDTPVNEAVFARPDDASLPSHIFEGRLELFGEETEGFFDDLQEAYSDAPERTTIPQFDYAFVQYEDYLVPVQRGRIVTDHPFWNFIIETGHVWQEVYDNGYSRASFPFTIMPKGGNATFNGTMTFLFNDESVSKVWYQITQETTSYGRANFYGLLDAEYHPESIPDADLIKTSFQEELDNRFPTKSIEDLAIDYPNVDASAFGQGVSPEHMTWFGVVVDGVNYLSGCQTRYGSYTYCESMRAASYSTAKSAFVSVALMRLAQIYGLEVADLLIKDYVPAAADSQGNWDNVSFNNALDMSTGNYESARFMADDDSEQMGEFFGAGSYDEHINLAFDWSNHAAPNDRWVYRTSDTFIVTSAMENFLSEQLGTDSDIFQFVVDEVYTPLGISQGTLSTIRTTDNNWEGQAEGGYGMWWIPDDIAKISAFLNNDNGMIDGEQILHPELLAATLQGNSDDRGVQIDRNRMYNNAFWSTRYSPAEFGCTFWEVEMQGYSGNVVVLMPNGVSYYYFSDNREFTWQDAVTESNNLSPFCP